MIKTLHTPNLTWIGSWWPKIWPHEYLISPIEISVNWPGSNCLEPGQLTLISMGLIRYSCGHILGHHEPIPTKFGVWRFFIMLYEIWAKIMKMLKKYFWWRHHVGTLFWIWMDIMFEICSFSPWGPLWGHINQMIWTILNFELLLIRTIPVKFG